MRIVRDIGGGNNFAHMTETPPVERRLTPVGQRYLILRSRRESRHECRHSYCPLRGMTRFVLRIEPSSHDEIDSGVRALGVDLGSETRIIAGDDDPCAGAPCADKIDDAFGRFALEG